MSISDLIDSINSIQAQMDTLRSAAEEILVAQRKQEEKEALEKERFKNVELADRDFLMTRKEAAAFIGRTERTLDRLCSKFKILRIEVDGDIRIRKSELLRYLGYDMSEDKEEGAPQESVITQLRKRYLGS